MAMATTAHGSATPKKKAAKTAPASTAKAPVTRTAPARKPRANSTKAKPVGADQRRNYVEVAAYYIAERRGFVGGSPAEDWATAEAEIDRLLLEGKLNN
jgi:hypothetical protein